MRKIYSPTDRAARERREQAARDVTNDNELDNGSVTDTLQWCELHRGHCHDVIPVRRCYDNPNRKSIIFFACPKCIRTLKKAGLISPSKYAGLECYEIVVPEVLSQRRGLDLSFTRPQRRIELRQQSYEVTLDALQVTYLRALGLKVIPT